MLGIGRQDSIFIAGLVQGLSLPTIEMLVAVLASAGTLVFFGGSVDSSSTLLLTFAVLLGLDVIRNVVIGLSHSRFSKGNIVGNVFGLGLFYLAVSAITSHVAAMSLLFTGLLAVSFAVGLIVYARSE
ncbi:MAG: hypothetical protein M1503_05510 [Thaumarchaeota archaeon]|nr:hypothetical protein [Nitrososphaerota archaeon]MCL5317705.1 hypothetical protein [Nitrososphaerota archaeon]